MREHNRTAAVSRYCAALAWIAIALIAAVPVLAQYNGSSTSSSRYGSSSSSTGSSRYSSSSSRYGGSSTASSLNSRYGSGTGSSSYGSNSGGTYLNRSQSKYKTQQNMRATEATKSGKNVDANTEAAQAERAKSGQQKVNITTRKAPTGKAAPTGKGGGTAAQAAVPPDYKSSALYFTPAFIDVTVGDRFDTQVVYFNRATEALDDMILWVHYDPAAIEPVWVDTKPLTELTGNPIDASVWREAGYVRISARIGRQIGNAVNPLVGITWRAVAPSVATAIDLGAPAGEQQSGFYADGKNILINNFFTQPADIRLEFAVTARVTDSYNAADVGKVRESLSAVDLDPLRRVRLAIIPPSGNPAPGQVATADVMLLNPGNVAFDHIRMRIRFQPELVQVLDADQDNYLIKGINIFDGDFHEKYPFDDLISNKVDEAAGVIEYEVGSLSGKRAYPGGTFARIVYRPLKQTNQAMFWFELTDRKTGRRSTDILADGVSLLGDSDQLAAAALHGAQIAIR